MGAWTLVNGNLKGSSYPSIFIHTHSVTHTYTLTHTHTHTHTHSGVHILLAIYPYTHLTPHIAPMSCLHIHVQVRKHKEEKG